MNAQMEKNIETLGTVLADITEVVCELRDQLNEMETIQEDTRQWVKAVIDETPELDPLKVAETARRNALSPGSSDWAAGVDDSQAERNRTTIKSGGRTHQNVNEEIATDLKLRKLQEGKRDQQNMRRYVDYLDKHKSTDYTVRLPYKEQE
jgi:hypothetical protein